MSRLRALNPPVAGGVATVIAVDGVSRAFGRVQALDDVSLTVAPGRLVGLLGPNGAGKSTLVRLICGLLRPDRGEVRVGRDLVWDAPERVRRRIGLVTDDPSLYGQMTAPAYLAFFAELAGIAPQAARRQADEWIERLGLLPHASKRLQALSRGNRQRVALARALIHEPDVLLMDEPSSGLDPESARHVDRIIAELKSQGRAILFCSHDLAEVERLADRVTIIRQGRVLLDQPLSGVGGIYAIAAPPADFDSSLIHGSRPGPAWAALNLPCNDITIRREGDLVHFELPLPAERAPDVAALLVGAGWSLLQLGPKQNSLERLYFEAIQGEAELRG